MYVCVCHAVTEREIAAAVAKGSRRLKDLRAKLRVGATCGRCTRCARQCLNEHAQRIELQVSQVLNVPGESILSLTATPLTVAEAS